MNTSLYVDRFYEMKPGFEDLRFGTDLRNGMIVLLADHLLRGDPERMNENGYEAQRVKTVNAWCTVSELNVIPRFGSPLIRFVGLYADGVKRIRTYDASYAWIVKLDSIEATA